METPQSNKVDKEKTISIIKSKIKELKNNYNFYTQYNDIIFKIIKNLEDLTYEKIANSLQDSYIKHQEIQSEPLLCHHLSFLGHNHAV